MRVNVWVGALSCAVGVVGCTGDVEGVSEAPTDERPGSDEQRVLESKSQQSGSCENSCGGRSNSGSCWCNPSCVTYGDCCDDYAPECLGETCENSCGGQSNTGTCWCNSSCTNYGDCCQDYVSECQGSSDPFDGLSGNALKDAVEAAAKQGHVALSYWNARKEMYYPNRARIDVRSDDKIEGIYTGQTERSSYDLTPGSFNTEHSWPKKNGAAASDESIADIHHLFPTDSTANEERGSYNYGTVDSCSGNSCPWAEGGSERGWISNSQRTNVFEVRSEHRGDVARAHFYFAMRYRDMLENIRSSHPNAMCGDERCGWYVLPSASEGLIPNAEEAVLREWHQQDPVDTRELQRNTAIQGVQGNSNPFVTNPDLVGRISSF